MLSFDFMLSYDFLSFSKFRNGAIGITYEIHVYALRWGTMQPAVLQLKVN